MHGAPPPHRRTARVTVLPLAAYATVSISSVQVSMARPAEPRGKRPRDDGAEAEEVEARGDVAQRPAVLNSAAVSAVHAGVRPGSRVDVRGLAGVRPERHTAALERQAGGAGEGEAGVCALDWAASEADDFVARGLGPDDTACGTGVGAGGSSGAPRALARRAAAYGDEEEEEGEGDGEEAVDEDTALDFDSDGWIRRQKAANVTPEGLLGQLGVTVSVRARPPLDAARLVRSRGLRARAHARPRPDVRTFRARCALIARRSRARSGAQHASSADELWQLAAVLISQLRTRMLPRQRLGGAHSTLDDAVRLLSTARSVVVVSGAGISVSAGIPDFRSANGVYQMVEERFNLPDPQALFDIHYFANDPLPFFAFAKNIYPGVFQPTRCHRFIRALEARGRLLRNYTQNIDTLEKVTGIRRKVTCHGSFETASCLACKRTVSCDEIRPQIASGEVPRCGQCEHHLGILKPDIVFFGESLGEGFERHIQRDLPRCDALVVVGSSMRVQPVAAIPAMLPPDVPQILINRELVLQPHRFDIELLGSVTPRRRLRRLRARPRRAPRARARTVPYRAAQATATLLSPSWRGGSAGARSTHPPTARLARSRSRRRVSSALSRPAATSSPARSSRSRRTASVPTATATTAAAKAATTVATNKQAQARTVGNARSSAEPWPLAGRQAQTAPPHRHQGETAASRLRTRMLPDIFTEPDEHAAAPCAHRTGKPRDAQTQTHGHRPR